MKENACFLNGDTVCKDKKTEIYLLNNAEELYKIQQVPFGTIHIDILLAINTEPTLLSDTGHNSCRKKEGVI